MSQRRTAITVTVDKETADALDELKRRLTKDEIVRVSKSRIVEFLIKEAAKSEDLSKVFKK